MKITFLSVIALTLAVAVPSWAGVPAPVPAPTSAPVLNEGGLFMLAVALAGTGLSLLRGRRN